jgi:hypothetical protein
VLPGDGRKKANVTRRDGTSVSTSTWATQSVMLRSRHKHTHTHTHLSTKKRTPPTHTTTAASVPVRVLHCSQSPSLCLSLSLARSSFSVHGAGQKQPPEQSFSYDMLSPLDPQRVKRRKKSIPNRVQRTFDGPRHLFIPCVIGRTFQA